MLTKLTPKIMRQIASLDSRAGAPVGKALEEAAKIVERLEAHIKANREQRVDLKEACGHMSMLVVELSKQLSDKAGGLEVVWRPINTAPRNGELIWVFCPEREGLSEMVSLCCWHEDAGFCVDEIRQPTLWYPILEPNAPQVSEVSS